MDVNRVAGMDLGVDNLATCATPDHGYLVGRRRLKSINQYYNKRLAYLKSRLDKDGDALKTSRRIQTLSDKRSWRIHDYMLKAARTIINLCIRENTATLIVGSNMG
ncbi:transposase [Atopobium sp. oral taxon 416]|uniref:transposase n=1 Tax=Atopobium sp. oral taxon 416 TaxID=712157 RepID=UPI001BA899B4|nr:transposase [Atopobium sp. oral taxon 416]QUC04141.1 transposase [Atopobium sp. oral taxon 416]